MQKINDSFTEMKQNRNKLRTVINSKHTEHTWIQQHSTEI